MSLRLPFPTLEDYVRRPENNYLLLRFFAALLVIYGHSYALTGLPGRQDIFVRVLGFTYAGDIGVDIFFVISGFLVSYSYLSRHNLSDYVKSRLLRIFPALLACLLVSAFVLGPLVSSLGALHYLASLAPYTYLAENLTLVRMQVDLPGVFEHLPVDGVNGSLWTLPVEVRLYVVVGLLGASAILGSRRWYLWFAAGICLAAAFLPTDIPLIYHRHWLRLCLLFALGSVACVYRGLVPLHWAGVLLLLALALPFRGTAAFPWLLSLWLAYTTFWVAYVPNLHFFNRLGDYSYGLYIYAFPTQQLLRQYFTGIGPWQMFAAATPLILLCAVLSWHFVEEPALRMKSLSWRQLYARATGQREPNESMPAA